MSKNSPSKSKWSILDVALIVGLVVVVAVLAVLVLDLNPFGGLVRRQVTLPDSPLTAQSDPQDVLTLMLYSHTTWQTVEIRAVETGRDPNTGQSTEVSIHIQVALPDKARLELGTGDGSLSFLWIGDGKAVLRESPEHAVYTIENIPRQDRAALRNYFPPSPEDESASDPHPLAILVPTRLAENLFPSGTAQSLLHGRKVAVLGEDEVAGRRTIVIAVQQSSAGLSFKGQTYWVDAETGVILKSQVCAADGEEMTEGYNCDWVGQVVVLEIVYGLDLPDQLFVLEPSSADSRAVSLEEFKSVTEQ